MYKIKENTVIKDDNFYIPMDNGNRDYQEYLEWISEGNATKPEFTEEELLINTKDLKRNQIRTEFEFSSTKPVIINSVSYHGGFDSAIKLDAAKRLNEAAGATEVYFFDVYNVGHNLTLAQAQYVTLMVAQDYQIKFSIKQSKMIQVDNATTIAEVELI